MPRRAGSSRRRCVTIEVDDDAAGNRPLSPLPPYTLRRSARARRLRVTIDPGQGLIVTVPPATRRGWAHPEAEIERFLREREGWVRRHLQGHAQQRAELAARGGLRDGATIRFRGELHLLRIVAAPTGRRRSTVAREGGDAGDELVVRLAPSDRRPIAAVLDAWFRERARVLIDAEIARHAPALGRQAGGRLRSRSAQPLGQRVASRTAQLLVAAHPGTAGGPRDGRHPRARPSPRLRPRAGLLGIGRRATRRSPRVAQVAPDPLARAPRGARREPRVRRRSRLLA